MLLMLHSCQWNLYFLFSGSHIGLVGNYFSCWGFFSSWWVAQFCKQVENADFILKKKFFIHSISLSNCAITKQLNVLSRTRIRVNLHSTVAWMSRSSLLKTGAISEFWVTATRFEATTHIRTHNTAQSFGQFG